MGQHRLYFSSELQLLGGSNGDAESTNLTMSLDGSVRWRRAGLLSALWHNAQKCSIFMWLAGKQRLQGISKLPSGLVLLSGFTSIQPHVPTPPRLYLFSLESHETPENSPRKEHTAFSPSTTVALRLAHNCTQQGL